MIEILKKDKLTYEILGKTIRVLATLKTSGYYGVDVYLKTDNAGKPWKRLNNYQNISSTDPDEAVNKGIDEYINRI